MGTPPAQRQISSLVWRLGPSHFLEEVLPAASVAAIYELGPENVGNFQAVYLPCKWPVFPSEVNVVLLLSVFYLHLHSGPR